MVATRTGPPQRLAEVIQSRRLELGITRKIVAQRSGLSQSTITRIEQGRFAKPTPDCLRAIADAIDMPSDELFVVAGWLTSTSPSSKPHVSIICQGIPVDVADEIHTAVATIAGRNGVRSDLYYRAAKSTDDQGA